MLRELHIKNFSIIDDVSIEFEKGFNVLTGETGAGKSIIINAFSLALGERATGEIIRKGSREAVIEAFLDISPESLHASACQTLEDSGIQIGDGLILKRIISAHGKNRAYVNGSMVTVQTLSEISAYIVDVHGQYEHQSLLSTEKQLDMLDAYGGLLSEREKVKTVFENLISTRHEITSLSEKDQERARRLDMLRFQISEIEAADLATGEDEALAEEARILGNAVRLAELAHHTYDNLYSSDAACIPSLAQILGTLQEITDIDKSAEDALKSVQSALPLLEEAGYVLRDYRDRMEFDPGRLEQVQERLELITNLKRKYGSSIEEIIEYKLRVEKELDSLQYSEERIESLKKELAELKHALTEKTRTLSEKRKQIAQKIDSGVVAAVSDLSMPHTKFAVHIYHEQGDDTTDGLRAHATGIDRIEFLISPNPGEDLKPLSKIASGGELSRIMLALKGILAKGDSIPVMVFDEIDSGIGGNTADTVARKLKALSSDHQVICITHLPQIASRADNHLKIEKSVKRDRTMVGIQRIDKDRRAAEVARMLGGKISDASLRHAEEMLKRVQ